MKVFISWSGGRSNRVAHALREFLPDVNQRIEPWMSGVDIKAGTRWSIELATQLQETSYGIICVTPESVSSSWLMFEAGALSKSVHDGCVCPYLIDISSHDILGPLSQFQHAEATKESTWNVVLQINARMGVDSILESRLRRHFDNYWPILEQSIKAAIKSEIESDTPKTNTRWLSMSSY
jgi:hypothetical protein